MKNQVIMKFNKIGQPELEVIRFNSADVIATSVIPLLMADDNELVANLTSTYSVSAPSSTITGTYHEPSSGQ